MKEYITFGGGYIPPTCKTIVLMQSSRICVNSDTNSRGPVNISNMSGGWDAED